MPTFLKEDDIAKAREERQKEWEAAYARIGQKPPGPPPDEQPFDGRPLAERLQEQRDKKEEEFQDRIALKHQWRGLDGEEVRFLAEKAAEKRNAEKQKEAEVDEELAKFRQAVSSRPTDSPPLPVNTTATPTTSATAPLPAQKAGQPRIKAKKSLLAGVKKKESAPSAPEAAQTAKRKADVDSTEASDKRAKV